METPRSLASSALTHPACRYTKAPNQITILRGNNEAWFLVNSIADKTRIHGVYVCICICIRIHVYLARRDGTWPCVSRKTDYRGHERLRFLSFSLNLLNPAKNRTHWNGHDPRLRVHFSTLLNTSYAIDQSPDLEPLRICVRYDCRGNACLNLRFKEFSDSKLVRSR